MPGWSSFKTEKDETHLCEDFADTYGRAGLSLLCTLTNHNILFNYRFYQCITLIDFHLLTLMAMFNISLFPLFE